MKLIFNDSVFHLTEQNIPCLIHGSEHSGSSFFTLALLTDLVMQGRKILFFSASEKAQLNFMQLSLDQKNIANIETIGDIRKEKMKQCLLVKADAVDLFFSSLQKITDIHERLIVIKNVEYLPESVFDAIANRENVILSGNIDRCQFKQKILDKEFKTKILFSNFDAMMVNLPPLDQYEAIFLGQSTGGLIHVAS
ncbi:MAG TPA: hypothetical protein VF820_02445 [Patescibacteria group bacterium]